MANISNISFSRLLRKNTRSANGTTAECLTAAAARSTAQTTANNASLTTYSNFSNSTDIITKRLGGYLGSRSTDIGEPYRGITINRWVCDWAAYQDFYQSQILVTFTLPSDDIGSATLTFTFSSDNTTSSDNFYIAAPANSSSNVPTTYTTSNSNILYGTKATFSGGQNSYSITITNQLSKCKSTNKNWLLIGMDDRSAGNRSIVISGITISYTAAYGVCGAPTSVNSSISIQKPGDSATISWSGASSGTNNTINGYTVYWRAGASPTTSTYTSKADVSTSTTSYTFNVTTNMTRGTIYYFKIVTKGTAGSSYYSSISDAEATVIVNSLPAVPSVSVDKTRIKSTSTSSEPDERKFTVTPGSDSDTTQSKTVRYATTPWEHPTISNTTKITSGTKLSLYQQTTYYFWTYDGLEFSSSYTSKTITVNTPPTIESITMSAQTTYTPSVTVSNVIRSYAKNINGTATNVTGNNVTYQWKLCVGSSSTTTSYGAVTNISTSTSLSNIDVTSYGANFDTAYKLRLVVTDDLGETATKDSSKVFVIPAAPTPTIVNNKNDNNIGNSSHFGRYIRIKYTQNTGITKQLQYSTSSTFASEVTTKTLSGTTYTDVDLNSLTRGTTYYFRVVYTCNTKTNKTSTTSLVRANNITPNITSISKQKEENTYVKPYTDSFFSFSFDNSPIAWNSDNDVGSTYGAIYSTKLVYSSRNLSLGSSGENSSGIVTGTATLNNTITAWETLINGSTGTAPVGTYILTLSITATNLFGETFTGTKTFTVDFRENPKFNEQPILQIKTGSSTYTTIDSSFTSSNLESNPYLLFATQTIRYKCNQYSIHSYINQPATLSFYKGNTVIATQSISASNWTYDSSTNKYRLNVEKNIIYTVPTIITDTLITLKVRIAYNNYTNYYAESNSNTQCKEIKINTSEIRLSIIDVNEDNSNIELTYNHSNNGGGSNAYSSKECIFTYCNMPNGTYNSFVVKNPIEVSQSNQTISGSSSNILDDIIYFGATLNLIANFVHPDGPNGNAVPTGTSIYTVNFTNLYTFYRQTPNLGYGKNFFFLNQNQPISGRADQILEISTAQYKDNNNQTHFRDTIYFGTDGSKFQITSNGLIINCGTWDS